jgi:hypothetical protein
MKRAALLMLLAGVAHAADRVPVAVVWLGDPASLDEGGRVSAEVGAALGRNANGSGRALDSAADRKALVEGGPATHAEQLIARGDAAFAKLKFSDAAKAYVEAEQVLLEDAPLSVAQRRLGAVERGLLACFDQLNLPEEATRAAERLGWTAGTNDDVQQLIERHRRDRRWHPVMPPVQVTSVPEGAQVYRNLQPVGVAPQTIAGGEPSIDAVDVELAGYRRFHQPLPSGLGAGNVVEAKLVKEDRIGVLVDDLRMQAPEPPAGQVAALGKRVGAARVLVIAPEGSAKIRARYVDVQKGGWSGNPLVVDAAGQQAMDKLADYVAPGPSVAVVAQPAKPAKGPDKPKSAWGKWYTWVAAGGVLVLIGTLLIVDRVGDDKLTVTAKH